jgi:ubiquinone/menaquinone biosynthesis C-methylase UbiE
MENAEFDRVAEEYKALHRRSIAASGEDPEFFARYKVNDAAHEARQAGLRVEHVLDFGCGVGNSLPHFAMHFSAARLAAADPSRRSLGIARERFPALRVDYVEISNERLPFDHGSFDLCFSACVFHHIPAAEHPAWLGELYRVTRPGGMLLLFEHNPFNPLTLAAVRDCPFDDNAVLIPGGTMRRRVCAAGWSEARTVYRIFFPHALAFARPVERLLRQVPLGAQYFVRAQRGDW